MDYKCTVCRKRGLFLLIWCYHQESEETAVCWDFKHMLEIIYKNYSSKDCYFEGVVFANSGLPFNRLKEKLEQAVRSKDNP